MNDLIQIRIARWCVQEMQRLTRKRYDLSPSDVAALGPEKVVELRRFLEDVGQELHGANTLQLRAIANEHRASAAGG